MKQVLHFDLFRCLKDFQWQFWGLPRCKNLWYFFFVSLARAGVWLSLMVSWLFCFLCFTSSVSLTGFYTEDEPNFGRSKGTNLLSDRLRPSFPRCPLVYWGKRCTELLVLKYRPIRLTLCCTQFKSLGVKMLCVLHLHDNVAFTFKWYGNTWNKTFYSQKIWIGYNTELAELVYLREIAVTNVKKWVLRLNFADQRWLKWVLRHEYYRCVFYVV